MKSDNKEPHRGQLDDMVNDAFSKKRILIAEDDELSRMIFSFQLQDEYDVFFANDGKAATDLVLSYHYDLIILDERMPKMSGSKANEEIRQYQPDVPIFGISASFGELSYLYEVKDKYDEVLAKPYDVDVLRNLIRKYI
ncbi:response regulator [Candidatus Woesearchaeota archaeon]|nr:response regulator [Candidatus Woesearchaeota archaeon]